MRLTIFALVLLLAGGATAQTAPNNAGGLDLTKLPPATRAALHNRAKHFCRLSDGTIIDRQNEIQFEKLAADAKKVGSQQMVPSLGYSVWSFPKTAERLAWGLCTEDGVVVEVPPLWESTTMPRAGLALKAGTVVVSQRLDDGVALGDIYFSHPIHHNYGFGHVVDLPGSFTDGGSVRGVFYLLREKEPYVYTTAIGGIRTVPSYRTLTIAKEELTPHELGEAIQLGTAELIDWSYKRRRPTPEEAKAGTKAVISWSRRQVKLPGLKDPTRAPAAP